jgi:predicted ester cyclase
MRSVPCPTFGMPFERHSRRTLAWAARVIVTGTLVGDFAGLEATGERFEIDQVVFAHFRGGLIVEVWEIADTAPLLRDFAVS